MNSLSLFRILLLLMELLRLPDVSGLRFQQVTSTDIVSSCDVYAYSSWGVGSTIQCGALALSIAAHSFYVCPSSEGTTLVGGRTPVTCTPIVQVFAPPQQSCSIYSTLTVPTKLPKQSGLKRYLLSTGKTGNGSPAALDASNYCSSLGAQFGTIESVSDHIKYLAEVGPEIKLRCVILGLVWVHMSNSLYWSNGEPLDQCLLPIATTEGNCFTISWNEKKLRRNSCTLDSLPVLCQKF